MFSKNDNLYIFQDYASESDKARSVRLLLAKHSDQVNQLISRQPTQLVRNNNPEPDPETSDDFVSHNHILPGDSFPSTANQLMAISMNDLGMYVCNYQRQRNQKISYKQPSLEFFAYTVSP